MRPINLLAAVALALLTGAPKSHAFDPIEPANPGPTTPMMINLAPLSDWSTQQPFIDRMKTARPWIGHKAGQWGGVEAEELATRGLLDPRGWPTGVPRDLASIGTLTMTDLPETALSLAGRYVLRFEGTGIVEVSGRARNRRYGKNEVRFDFTPGPGAVEIKIQRSDPGRTGDYVRNITVMRVDREAAYAAGARFNPDLLARLSGFSGLRFMDWMRTNHATVQDWGDRPRADDYTYGWRGAPLEVIIALANTLGVSAWLTLPHKADDDFMRSAALLVRDQLDPGLVAYVEYSNEVWNWSFKQAHWADAQARARWNQRDRWMEFYGMRAAQMAQIWRAVFADAPHRLTTVIATHTGWRGLEDQILNAPLWQAEDPANPPPYRLFDAYAITGYFGGTLGSDARLPMVRNWLAESAQAARDAGAAQGLTGADLRDHMSRHRHDLAIARAGADLLDGRVSGLTDDTVQHYLGTVLPYHHSVAQDHGLDLIVYEGGTHVVGLGAALEDTELDAFYRAFNYSPEMGALYTHLLAGWADQAGGAFAHYYDVGKASRWGSWGALRTLTDSNPRWDAIVQFRKDAGG